MDERVQEGTDFWQLRRREGVEVEGEWLLQRRQG